jgi:hypothetical protein
VIVVAEYFVTGVRRCIAASGLATRVVDKKKAVGFLDWQKSQHYCIGKAKDCRVGSYPKPERQNRYDREAGIAAKYPCGVSKISR